MHVKRMSCACLKLLVLTYLSTFLGLLFLEFLRLVTSLALSKYLNGILLLFYILHHRSHTNVYQALTKTIVHMF